MQTGCTETEKNKMAFLLQTRSAKWTQATQKQKGLDISFILHPNNLKSGGLSEKHFPLGLGMIDIY